MCRLKIQKIKIGNWGVFEKIEFFSLFLMRKRLVSRISELTYRRAWMWMCPPGFHRVTTSTTCRQLDLQDTESLVLKWWDCFLHLAWVLFWFTKISSSQYYQEFSKTQLCWFWSQYVELSMAPSYMYVYPHICNHFSWLRAWCWFRLKVNKRGQVQIIYGTGWAMHWIFSTLQVSCAPIYFWETACLHSLPPNFVWVDLSG